MVEAGTQRPLAELVVRAYDRDAFSDDFLGEARTDADGRFAIVYATAHFRDLVETRPDLYLVVLDAAGTRELCSTRDEVRRDCGADERFAIAVAPERLAAS